MIDMRIYYRGRARVRIRIAQQRLRRGNGVGGVRLKPKARADGKTLGASVVQDLARGRIRSSDDGFRVDYSHLRDVVRFDEGTPGGRQEERPILGLTEREREDEIDDAADELVRQMNEGVR